MNSVHFQPPPRLLVIDDDPVVRESLLGVLEAWSGVGLITTACRTDMVDRVRDEDFELVLLDAGSSVAAALERLAELKAVRPDVPVIMISSHGDEQWAVHAIQAGAVDFIREARIGALLVHAIKRALENIRLAREVEMLKMDLVGMVSHDIRAPTSNIIGFSDLLLDDNHSFSGRPADRAKVERIRSNGLFILHLIDDLMDMARIDCGVLRLVLGRHDVAELVRESIDRCTFFAKGKQIQLVSNPPPTKSVVIVDRSKVVQVLSNLLSNAIKFSPENSEVTVTARIEADAAVFRVEDRGLGIPAGELDLLFKKFSVTSTRATRGEKGSGLGLYIVSEFTKLHQGSIQVESESGRGSAFTVRLPQDRGPRSSPQRPVELAVP